MSTGGKLNVVGAELTESSRGSKKTAVQWATLPEFPLIRIRASQSWQSIEFREVWDHRELLYFLVWRDLKVRYKQTVLGASWVILQPLLMTLVFALFLGKIARVPSGNVPYILFLYSGLLPWTFFSNAVSTGSHSLIANSHMITRVYFPRSLVPAAAVLVRLSDFVIAAMILVLLMAYYRIGFTWSVLIVPILIFELSMLAMALSFWLSALNVKYRDIGTALPVILQLWMFTSPIVYPVSMVPEKWRFAYELNPLSGVIEGFRSALLGTEFNWQSLFISALVTLSAVILASFAFKRLEDGFAEVV
jgi:lipopolysaccharide transport system permease protein